ncbi:MAG: PKD domain-containing protein [Candidatus Limnocylindria bacterium]
MRQSRASRLVLILVLFLTLIGGMLPVAAAASTELPLPASMAAVGDSITQAASTGGTLGADAPHNSWSTGTSSTVDSHYLRLQALGAALSATNLSVSGAKVAGLNAQMQSAVALDPDPGYLTVLIGGNDLCTDTVAEMTSPEDFETEFAAAMTTISTGSPNTNVYVVSIPDVYQLWSLFKSSFWARFVWSSANICQSLLANPTSNQQVDVERRATVRQRNIDYNATLAEICSSHPRCRFDDNAVFNTTLVKSDVSGDYFHPSVSGQAKLASVSWGAGYTWTTDPAPPAENQPPTAAFSSVCTDLTCAFTDASADADGTIASWRWDFGDGGISSGRDPSHTYAAAGPYTVTLTVTDDDSATASTSASVTVSAASAEKMRVADLAGSAVTVNRNNWRATVVITVSDTSGAPVSGATVSGSFSPGGSASCTTSTAGTCSVSVTLSSRKVAGTTFTVTGMTGPLVYDSTQNIETSATISRP